MKRFRSTLAFGMGILGALATIAPIISAQTFTTFDVPNSTLTQPTAINAAGQITGTYRDPAGQHNFLRKADGSLISFDFPVSHQPGQPVLTGSTSINDVGQIVGYAYPVTDIAFAFLRQPDGTFERFFGDCAGPTRPANVFTSMVLNQPRGFWFEGAIPFAINNRGQIAGGCSLDIGIYHWSFLRQPDGTIIVFEPEHDIIPRSQALAMNSGGQITGIVRDMSGVYHGYLREPDGSITIFDASSAGTTPTAINPRGQVAGYIDPVLGSGGRGFLRQLDGTIVLVDAPNAISTQPTGINPRGDITGVYVDANNIYHGFLRDKHGTLTTFDVPNAINTYPTGMNPRGDITGWYSDAGGVHGFIARL